MYERINELTYHIGDEIQVNGIGFYVIADSSLKQDYVVAMKKDVLTTRTNFGSTTDYDTSTIKNIIDNWAILTFTNEELKEVDGYYVRLIKKEELENNLGCVSNSCSNSQYSWIRSSSNGDAYWTMTPRDNSGVWMIRGDQIVGSGIQWSTSPSRWPRPVINVYKSAIKKTN